MLFTVLPARSRAPSPEGEQAFLIRDNWNDWYTFWTLFSLVVFDENGERHNAGSVKIGQFGMTPTQELPDIPETFDALDERFFSLGQDENYYETINKIDSPLRERISFP